MLLISLFTLFSLDTALLYKSTVFNVLSCIKLDTNSSNWLSRIFNSIYSTHIKLLFLQNILYHFSSWDITIPPRSLYTLTLIPVASRELFIAALMSMILNYTRRNPCLLVLLYSTYIPLESINQALHHPTQRSAWFDPPWTFHIHHFPPQSSWN